jgi:hypothetical protein
MDTTSGNFWQADDPQVAALMQAMYARLWYEMCVELARRGGYVATFAGRSVRKANLYRVPERDWPPRSQTVYHFFEVGRFACACQGNAPRPLPCAHIGATVLYLQQHQSTALAQQ